MNKTHEVYFNNIEFEITKLLRQSTAVMGCISWFTNHRLLNKLYEMDWLRIMVNDDEINNEHLYKYKELIAYVNKNKPDTLNQDALFMLCKNYNDFIMHNKYMILMKNRKPFAVITGSYNWTYRANDNLENIIVFYDKETLDKYVNDCRVNFNFYNNMKALKKLR